MQRFWRKDIALGRQKQLFHILSSDAETSSADTGNDSETVFPFAFPLITEFSKMLNARDFVSRRAVIFSNLCFNNEFRVKFTG